jgi:diguanylate cyclase (GGDEF)-like protein
MTVSTPTIAFLATWLDGWYQSQLWRGAVAGSRLHNCRLLTLVGYARPESSVPSGPEGIIGVAARRDVDAYLFSTGPLSYWEGTDAMAHMCTWLPKRPMVSLGQTFPGMDSVIPDGGGIDIVVRHMVKSHRCSKIAFISGPETNSDSAHRSADFFSTIMSLGIATDSRWMEPGDFTLEGGERAMEILLERIGVPDAVVAANDAMAMGAVAVLRRHGLDVPLDVRVTGYDNSEEARSHSPSLTTIHSPTHFIGLRGLELALERLKDPTLPPAHDHLSTSLVVRKSCGCLIATTMGGIPALVKGKPSVQSVGEIFCDPSDAVREGFLRQLQKILHDADEGEQDEWAELILTAARNISRIPDRAQREASQETLMQAQSVLVDARQGLQASRLREMGLMIRELHRATNLLLEATEPSRLIEILAALVPSWCPEGMRLFLFDPDFQPHNEYDLSLCKFQVRLDLRHGDCQEIPDSEDLLPEEVVPGEIWTGVPLEQGSFRFGIALFRNWTRNEAFVEHLRLSLSVGIHQVWKHGEEMRLREQINQKSIRDELTGLYNRRGLKEVGHTFANQSDRHDRRFLVFMADLDGLKGINDRFGHAQGDEAIRLMADALQECFRRSDVLARLGGDEFAVICHLTHDADPEQLASRLQEILSRTNQAGDRDWLVRTSLGWSEWDPVEDPDMLKALEQADVRLYRDKAAHKAASE